MTHQMWNSTAEMTLNMNNSLEQQHKTRYQEAEVHVL